MKIISKFKDNYDFMVSKYGLDETLVYDRRNFYSSRCGRAMEA